MIDGGLVALTVRLLKSSFPVLTLKSEIFPQRLYSGRMFLLGHSAGKYVTFSSNFLSEPFKCALKKNKNLFPSQLIFTFLKKNPMFSPSDKNLVDKTTYRVKVNSSTIFGTCCYGPWVLIVLFTSFSKVGLDILLCLSLVILHNYVLC